MFVALWRTTTPKYHKIESKGLESSRENMEYHLMYFIVLFHF